MARRGGHPGLAAYVDGYCGYVERAAHRVRRREMPSGRVPLIVSFGDPIDVAATSERRPADRLVSFVAGFSEGYGVTEHAGRQHGIEVNLSPLGIYRLLGVDADELANEAVALDALMGRPGEDLADRLASAPDWATRFDRLDRVLLGWADDGPVPDPAVTWAWRQLRGAHGQVAVGVLADEIGWSRRHFIARFKRQVGLAPKPTARVLRFSRAVQLLKEGRLRSISDVAAVSGYADHSHLDRDFRAFAGYTPSELMAAQLPYGGVAG
ncbi:MAG: helix-turn-helix domain-containing protein [Acidimicrobiales bacterium]